MKDELTKLEALVDGLTQEVGEILNDKPTQVVHMVVARFFVEVSMEASPDKVDYMDLCSTLWDAMADEMAEEPRH